MHYFIFIISIFAFSTLMPVSALGGDPSKKLTQFMFYESLSEDVVDIGVTSYSDFMIQRRLWDLNIERLEKEVEACGDCPKRLELLAELKKWEAGVEMHDEVVWGVLELFSFGDETWRDSMGVFLGLVTPDEYQSQRIPSIEVHRRLKAQGVPKQCRDYYSLWESCTDKFDRVHGTLRGSPCYDLHKIFLTCSRGDSEELRRAVDVMAAREKGLAIPEVWERTIAERGIVFHYYGVSNDFKPPLPSREMIDDYQGDKWFGHGVRILMRRDHGYLREVSFTGVPDVLLESWYRSPPREEYGNRRYAYNQSGIKSSDIISCTYINPEDGFAYTYAFWYEKKGIDALTILETRQEEPNHPFHRIRVVRDDCPLRLEEAMAVAGY